jgi:hypothetical protein
MLYWLHYFFIFFKFIAATTNTSSSLVMISCSYEANMGLCRASMDILHGALIMEKVVENKDDGLLKGIPHWY